MSIVVFANMKGGVGKSTLTVHFARWLTERRAQRVAVIDLDSQRNATSALQRHDSGVRAASLFSPAPLPEAARTALAQPLAVFAGSTQLVDVDLQSAAQVIPPFVAHVRAIAAGADVVVIDTPPAPGLRMAAALMAAQAVACPIELEDFSLEGVQDMLRTVQGIRAAHNPQLALLGLVVNRFNVHSKRQKEALTALLARHHHLIVPARVANRTAIPEAIAEGVSLWQLRKSSARDAAAELEQVFGHLWQRMQPAGAAHGAAGGLEAVPVPASVGAAVAGAGTVEVRA